MGGKRVRGTLVGRKKEGKEVGIRLLSNENKIFILFLLPILQFSLTSSSLNPAKLRASRLFFCQKAREVGGKWVGGRLARGEKRVRGRLVGGERRKKG